MFKNITVKNIIIILLFLLSTSIFSKVKTNEVGFSFGALTSLGFILQHNNDDFSIRGVGLIIPNFSFNLELTSLSYLYKENGISFYIGNRIDCLLINTNSYSINTCGIGVGLGIIYEYNGTSYFIEANQNIYKRKNNYLIIPLGSAGILF